MLHRSQETEKTWLQTATFCPSAHLYAKEYNISTHQLYKIKQNTNQIEYAHNSMRYIPLVLVVTNTCISSIRSISFSSTAFGPMCLREKASVEGAIWFKLNFWVELEEQRANRTEAPIDRLCDDNSQSTVFHNLLAYNRRPARKALRYMVRLRSWEN